ncbi:MAG TPA: hypothetical protein VFY03_06210 [Woeseiaceae bacterium]|nr:hypothetical protein [Woeseiaceae bacterium]
MDIRRNAWAGVVAAGWWSTGCLAVPTIEDGYEVTRSQTVTPAPHGSVGRKTVDTETRVGNTPETDGNSATYTMTLGGFVKICPSAAGIATGTFEYAIVADIVDTDAVPVERTHYANRMTARLEGHVGDDAKLGYVDGKAEFVRERSGAPTERHTVPIRFTPRRDGRPDMPAMEAAVEATADISAAILIWQAGQVFLDAERQWMKVDECAEIAFEPASETVTLEANAAANVRVLLRTKDAKRPISDGKLDINAIGGIGTPAPRSGVTGADGAARVTYTASAEPHRGHGLDIGAVSRAGTATAKWTITEPGLVLLIEHRLADRRDTVQARAGYAIFDGTVSFEAAMQPDPHWPGRQVAVLEIVRTMNVGHVTPGCSGTASQQEEWELRGTVDTAAGQLNLTAFMAPDPDNAQGYWVCKGMRDELNVYKSSKFSHAEPLAMPATTGSRQQFTARRSDGVDETLTVTVKSGGTVP